MKRQAVKCTRKIYQHLFRFCYGMKSLTFASRKGWLFYELRFQFKRSRRRSDVSRSDGGPRPFAPISRYSRVSGGPGGLQAQHQIRAACQRDGKGNLAAGTSKALGAATS